MKGPSFSAEVFNEPLFLNLKFFVKFFKVFRETYKNYDIAFFNSNMKFY